MVVSNRDLHIIVEQISTTTGSGTIVEIIKRLCEGHYPEYITI